MAKKKVTKATMPMQVVNKSVQIDVSYKVPTQRTLLRKSKLRKAPIIMDDDKNFHICNVKKYK